MCRPLSQEQFSQEREKHGTKDCVFGVEHQHYFKHFPDRSWFSWTYGDKAVSARFIIIASSCEVGLLGGLMP